MKEYIYLILAFTLSSVTIAQKSKFIDKNAVIEVKYLTFMDKGTPLSRESELLINNSANESLYITDYETTKIIDDSNIKTALNETNNVFKIKTYFRYKYMYTNTLNQLITSVDWLSSKTVQYEETIPKLEWKLISETKIIENYVCFKAKVNFRGREFIAWYTNDIPLPYGPLKFSGLPGLIIEIYDSKKEYTIVANKILFNSQKKINKIPDTDLKMSLKEFVEKYDELNNHNNWGKDVKGVVISQDVYVRDALELIYEWEEQEK